MRKFLPSVGRGLSLGVRRREYQGWLSSFLSPAEHDAGCAVKTPPRSPCSSARSNCSLSSHVRFFRRATLLCCHISPVDLRGRPRPIGRRQHTTRTVLRDSRIGCVDQQSHDTRRESARTIPAASALPLQSIVTPVALPPGRLRSVCAAAILSRSCPPWVILDRGHGV